jgi:hypothetical protein
MPSTKQPCTCEANGWCRKHNWPVQELVNHPEHYNFSALEVIDVIESWNLCFHLGNAIKYIARAPYKGDVKSDLKKAIWYLQRKLELELEKDVPFNSKDSHDTKA